ncbi:hypothetical protein G7054_g5587 [Neopestalotiopsis clavispora]|nr:hypothetical protein G7054_g5587 [Neopestalotiopsis clavispora]
MERHWQHGNPLSAIQEQTCVLGGFERDELPELHPVLQQEFAYLDDVNKQDQMQMTVWRDYARWKSSWLSNIPAELDTSRTQDELIANEYRAREDFETNPQQLLALHPLARALYRGTSEELKENPFHGPVLRGYLVAYNNMLKCFDTEPQPADFPGRSQDDGQSTQTQTTQEMSEVVPLYLQRY